MYVSKKLKWCKTRIMLHIGRHKQVFFMHMPAKSYIYSVAILKANFFVISF